ncbi:hypothetical protein [Malonomonas rubra]|uniref:hypothetical protein n=1 Tax=Malonomonas rubra TaxID=57040 RepID=UPI0026F174E0|nr:hypothetical protein [Malonomonas rubra]
MDRKKQNDPSLKDYREELRVLRDSDYWNYLPRKTQANILNLIGDQHSPYPKDQ